ncbi:coiled-coil domain-containing protein 40 isoform X2 [Chelonoidis abingdonii]|uniref:coiled-coil domain-containing protein 40 isoform X2 n=1 Tax=Chelonoidis abingdonii TaxID=106734 RepID=UPI0013F23B6E|nr:coiled-coil domain-containing protein 40 isoform X2 [Chelonoidis abingdonii]
MVLQPRSGSGLALPGTLRPWMTLEFPHHRPRTAGLPLPCRCHGGGDGRGDPAPLPPALQQLTPALQEMVQSSFPLPRGTSRMLMVSPGNEKMEPVEPGSGPESDVGQISEEEEEKEELHPKGNGVVHPESSHTRKEEADGVSPEEPGMELSPAEHNASESPEPLTVEGMQPENGDDKEEGEAVPTEDPGERLIPKEQEVSGAMEQETSGAMEQEVSGAMEQEIAGATEKKVAGAMEQEVSGATEKEVAGATEKEVSGTTEKEVTGATEKEVAGAMEQVVSAVTFGKEKFKEVFSDQVEVDNLPPKLPDMEQPVIDSWTRSRRSSGASTQRSALSVHMEIHAESDSAFQQFNHHLSRLGSEEENESLHYADEQAEIEGSEETEEEIQLIVLDPEHPLMRRFQAALKNYLSKQMEKVTMELRELTVATKQGKVQREELGMVLYGVQQQLARLQMELEKNQDRYSQIAMVRRQLEEELQDIRHLYKKTCQSTEDERKKVSVMQTEVENLALRLFYMQNMDQDVRDDISVMKRAVKKAEADRNQAEVEKKKQDLLVDRLTRKFNELQEQIGLYEAQFIAQAEDTKITRKAVSEACMEIQTINMEKKQLMHQWDSSLTGMKRRDEAYSAMQEALRQSKHQLKSLETEIQVYKKSVMKEEERNELLASILNRSENDGNMSKKLIAQCMAKQDALKVEYSTYTRTLHETEQALSRASSDRAARMNELQAISKEIEKETEARQELENQIMAKLQDQLMSNKAAKYFSQLAAKLHKRKLDLELHFSKVENDTAQVILDTTHTNCRLAMLQKTFSELDKEMKNINDLINHSENEIAKRNLLIERKQGVINLFNKKMEMMISQLGGQELGPLEVEINRLTKQIDEYNSEVMTLQKYWLRLQKELVKLTHKREEQLASLDMLKKQITIMEQKKVRTENEIQQEKNEQKDIERHMRNMANDLMKLNMLINKNSHNSEELQHGNTIMENEFVRSLKAAERESIEMQEKLDRLHEEKERLLNSLVEAEHQIMLWEKKIQLAKEMRAAVDSETGQGEIRAMRTEIHRMQVRYSQLTKQQEKMIRDMEAAVSRRETIMIRGEGQSKMDKKHFTKSDFHHKTQELRKKIKETQKNAQDCNRTITELENTQKSLSISLLEKQQQLSSLQAEADVLDADIERLQDKKRWNLSEIVAYQNRRKHLQAVKDGKYTPLCRTQQALQKEQQQQQDRLHTINVIIHQIQQEYPQYQRVLCWLSQALDSRLGSQEAE